MVDVRRLKVLCEVARRGSFSAAAASLGYTQPAISRQVALLEAELGTVLVRRLPQGVALTDAGRVLVARGEAILGQLDDLELEVGALAGLEGGRLRFAAFSSACASIVPRVIARFRERYPAVELAVTMSDPVGVASASAQRRGRPRAHQRRVRRARPRRGHGHAGRSAWTGGSRSSLRRADVPRAAARSSARRGSTHWPWTISRASRGCRPFRAPVRTPSYWPRRATRRASSPGSCFRTTTTRCFWALSRPAWAWLSSPIWQRGGCAMTSSFGRWYRRRRAVRSWPPSRPGTVLRPRRRCSASSPRSARSGWSTAPSPSSPPGGRTHP